MTFTWQYDSPLGRILLAADEVGVTGIWFEGAKYFAATLPADHTALQTPVLLQASRWLDAYFSGRKPEALPPLHPIGTAFRMAVWERLLRIPYGRTTTYGAIARELAEERGLSRMSAQAVGGAVGHNGISILIPCHRVLGADGGLTGYAGGVERKSRLLELEQGVLFSGEDEPGRGPSVFAVLNRKSSAGG